MNSTQGGTLSEIKAKVAYGIFLDLPAAAKFPLISLSELDAEKFVEIAVKHNELIKEFTIVEFLRRLGF